jgi:hypothetical protein
MAALRRIVLKKSMIGARCWSARRERSTPYPSAGAGSGGPNGAKDEFHLAATAQNLRKMAKLIPMSRRSWRYRARCRGRSQAQAIELQDAFEVREQHLDLLSLPS